LYPDAVVPLGEPWQIAGEYNGSHIYGHSWNVSLESKLDLPGAGTFTSLTSYLKNRPIVGIENDGAYAPSCLNAPPSAAVCFTPFVVREWNQTFQEEVTFASEPFGDFSFVVGAFYLHDKAPRWNAANPDFDGHKVISFES